MLGLELPTSVVGKRPDVALSGKVHVHLDEAVPGFPHLTVSWLSHARLQFNRSRPMAFSASSAVIPTEPSVLTNGWPRLTMSNSSLSRTTYFSRTYVPILFHSTHARICAPLVGTASSETVVPMIGHILIFPFSVQPTPWVAISICMPVTV